jgi:acyl-CoA thioester hydrolase
MRTDYPYVQTIPTRWMDNDVYGHVNNVTYYSYFDTVIHTGAQIGLCAESHCTFLAPIEFPQTVQAGLRVEKLGRASVRYAIGLFIEHRAEPVAVGWFVHVFVDRATRKSVPIAEPMRAALQRLHPA